MLLKRNNRLFGLSGENLASSILQKNGYKIIQRNFRSRFGEIDIVARENGALVAVEVKTRLSLKFGAPQEAVTPWKISKIKKTLEYFSLIHPEYGQKLRIDVLAIVIENGRLKSSKIIKVY